MSIDFEQQLKWFTKRLLQIRIHEVGGFSLPIPFKLSEISENSTPAFEPNISAQEHLEDLIEEIRGYYVCESKTPVNGDNIRLKYFNNEPKVKIYGIDSELLRSFIIERLKEQTSLFRTASGNKLLYVEKPTDVVLSATEVGIFSTLRSNKDNGGKFLSYSDILAILAKHKGSTLDEVVNYYDTDEKAKALARSAISYLLKKIKKSPLFTNIENEKIIKNERGQGYILMM
ncbi:MAG: helix-turn-helix domain-containing protein [bacterium]